MKKNTFIKFICFIFYGLFVYFLFDYNRSWFKFFGGLYILFIWFFILNKIDRLNNKIYEANYVPIQGKSNSIYENDEDDEDDEDYIYDNEEYDENEKYRQEYEECAKFEQAKKFYDNYTRNH